MKVTTIMPDALVEEVRFYSRGKNITDSLIIALREWVALKHLAELHAQVEEFPLQFTEEVAESRDLNRQ